ncbi:DUF3071 domain-containing protein [Nanchangia anserum]|uniref:DUF3071 domain-containing protein n=1 Tax=Nanchangia anserum TaxID=2692125 RepID=A0A8I0G6S1_9ACTO|nr:septation protein SepH [Nanchangia anserum]MBD3688832.1 DUF3071 domain-containing protein [Nanchangia anserum]QOX81106.1 DUF3071 domain-containing protein [Nanchangia anserum]
MKDVHVLGVHPDGNQLILSDADGARYSLQITDALRDACKVTPPLRPVSTRSEGEDPSPREIQELIRAGASAEQISHEFGTAIEKIRRYEGPILAERAYAARRAQALPIGVEADSPTLGDLVVDRLAARGVSPHSLSWDAQRSGHSKQWEILVRFVQNAEEHEAHWSADFEARHVSAIDEEAAWLTERSAPAGRDRGYLASRPSPEIGASEQTADLVESLNAQRGIRQEIDMSEFADDDTEAESSPSPVLALTPTTIPAPASPTAAEDQDDEPAPTTGPLPGLESLEAEEPATSETPASHPPRRSRQRRSVPSWEEIMFGSQPR